MLKHKEINVKDKKILLSADKTQIVENFIELKKQV